MEIVPVIAVKMPAGALESTLEDLKYVAENLKKSVRANTNFKEKNGICLVRSCKRSNHLIRSPAQLILKTPPLQQALHERKGAFYSKMKTILGFF